MHVSWDVECHGAVFLNEAASSHSQIASKHDPEESLQLQTSCRKTNTSTIVCVYSLLVATTIPTMLTRAALYTRGLGSRSVRALSTHSGFAGQGQGIALQQQQQQHQHSRSQWQATAATFAAAAAAAATAAVATATVASCDDSNSDAVYTRAQVSAHKGGASGTWVTYKVGDACTRRATRLRCQCWRSLTPFRFDYHPQDGVYDVTQFVEDHPGGKERIMMAAGERERGGRALCHHAATLTCNFQVAEWIHFGLSTAST